MAIGNDSDFDLAWIELRETFIRKLAREHFGLNISMLDIRSYNVSAPLDLVLDEIKRRNIFESTMIRAGRRIRVVLRMNSAK
jgi:hypothetical protein